MADWTIVLTDELLSSTRTMSTPAHVEFAGWARENVYGVLRSFPGPDKVAGSITLFENGEQGHVEEVGYGEDEIRVLAFLHSKETWSNRGVPIKEVRGFVRTKNTWHEGKIQVIPAEEDLFSRQKGILETDIISDSTCLFLGIGSLGAPIALDMVRSGVKNFIVIDHDILEAGNVSRHPAGLSQVGRSKVAWARDAILDINPYAKVEPVRLQVTWDNYDACRELVRKCTLSFVTTDNRESKVIWNKASVEERRPSLYAGAFTRAYGGMVFLCRPGVTLCYQCFLEYLGDRARDEEVSNRAQAERIQYADRPVPIEPGLATDLSPLATMASKLALQHLLAGKNTTLHSLDEDLNAPPFLWLNRREAGTDFAKLDPMGTSFTGMHVLRWYGINHKRLTNCPTCGDAVIHDSVELDEDSEGCNTELMSS